MLIWHFLTQILHLLCHELASISADLPLFEQLLKIFGQVSGIPQRCASSEKGHHSSPSPCPCPQYFFGNVTSIDPSFAGHALEANTLSAHDKVHFCFVEGPETAELKCHRELIDECFT